MHLRPPPQESPPALPRGLEMAPLWWSARDDNWRSKACQVSRVGAETVANTILLLATIRGRSPVLVHLVASVGTHLLDVEVTACRLGAHDRRLSVRTPRGRRHRRGRRFSGGRDSEIGAVRGAHVAPLGTLAFRVGPAVRISFAPAGSQERTGGVISGTGRRASGLVRPGTAVTVLAYLKSVGVGDDYGASLVRSAFLKRAIAECW
jgi:hypothetical protein